MLLGYEENILRYFGIGYKLMDRKGILCYWLILSALGIPHSTQKMNKNKIKKSNNLLQLQTKSSKIFIILQAHTLSK